MPSLKIPQLLLSVAVMTLACGRTASVEAGTVTFALDVVINGSTPTGSTPWLTAEFKDIGGGVVELTMTNLMPSSNFVDDWMFNFNGDASALTATYVSGPKATTGVHLDATQDLSGGNNIKAGLFNIQFEWPVANNDSNRFSGGETSVYDFSGTGLTASMFKFFSIDKPNPNGSTGGWYTAAHVQGFGRGLSGSIGTSQDVVAPEPASMAVWGSLVLAGLAYSRRRKVVP